MEWVRLGVRGHVGSGVTAVKQKHHAVTLQEVPYLQRVPIRHLTPTPHISSTLHYYKIYTNTAGCCRLEAF